MRMVLMKMHKMKKKSWNQILKMKFKLQNHLIAKTKTNNKKIIQTLNLETQRILYLMMMKIS